MLQDIWTYENLKIWWTQRKLIFRSFKQKLQSNYSDSLHSTESALLLKKTETNLVATKHKHISKPKDLLMTFFAPLFWKRKAK